MTMMNCAKCYQVADISVRVTIMSQEKIPCITSVKVTSIP